MKKGWTQKHPAFSSSLAIAILVLELQPKLDNARVVSSCDLTEEIAAERPVRIAELSVIENIEEFRAEFQGAVLAKDWCHFGDRQDPFSGEGAFHSGVDISASQGTPVYVATFSRDPDLKAAITDHGSLTASLPTFMKAAGQAPGKVCGAGFDLSPAISKGIEDGYISVVIDQHRQVAQHRIGEPQITLDLVHHGPGRNVIEANIEAAPLTLDLVGEFARAPLLGFDHLAAAGADDSLVALDCFLDLGVARIRAENKNSFVAPHALHVLLTDLSPTSEQGAIQQINTTR